MTTHDDPATCEQPTPHESPQSRPVLPEVVALVEVVTSGDYGLLLGHVGSNRLREIFEERTAKGVETYGRALTSHNGRCAVTDALQEAADLVQYLVQAAMEAEDRAIKTGQASLRANLLRGSAAETLCALALLVDLLDRG